MSYDSKLKALREWGCDVDGAMHRVLDDAEFYFQCIEEFIEDANFKILENALEERNLLTAFDSAHTIKGVSGNLGLTPVFEAAVELVEPLRLREDKDYSEPLKALYAQLSALGDIVG